MVGLKDAIFSPFESDKKYRKRAIVAVIAGGVIGLIFLVYVARVAFSGEGCVAEPNVLGMTGLGAGLLFVGAVVYWIASYVVYGLICVPSLAKRSIERRKFRKEQGRSVSVKEWCVSAGGVITSDIAPFVLLLVGVAVAFCGIAYGVALLLRTIFC